MSFALSTPEVEWGSLGLGAVFAQKGNLVRPKFLNMIREILRFGREAPRVLLPENEAKYQDVDLGTYLKTNGYSKFFAENYVVPMCAAIWSCSDQDTHKFPIRTLITFWVNHHLLNVVQRPVWRVVKGRSAAYVDAVVAALPEGSVRVNAPVVEVITDPTGNAKVSVKYTQGAKEIIETFDDVIMACHSDQALALLKDSGIDSETKAALTRIRYQPNDVYLHTDKSLMPANRQAWASWNCLKGTRGGDDVQSTNGSLDDPAETNDNDNHNENSQSVCVTYWVNLLQNLPKHAPDVFVTLNPPRPPREGTGLFFPKSTLPILPKLVTVCPYIANARTRRDYYDQKGLFPLPSTLTVYSYQSRIYTSRPTDSFGYFIAYRHRTAQSNPGAPVVRQSRDRRPENNSEK